MNTSINSYMMPFSNVAHLSLEDKLTACRAAGYSELSLMPREVEGLLSSGLSIADIVAICRLGGVRITRLDPLTTWPRLWRPENMDDAYIESVATTPDRFFKIAEELGCTHMSLNALFPPNALPLEDIVRDYAAICRRAADAGLICDLEFIPLWGVPTLEMAWAIVSGACVPNGGIVFDSWHFIRSASSFESLRAIPGSAIHCVQLNDSYMKLPAGKSLEADCYERMFPGEGEFPLAKIVAILAAKNALRQVGPEVFSPRLRAMTAEAVGIKSRDSIEATLKLAGVRSTFAESEI